MRRLILESTVSTLSINFIKRVRDFPAIFERSRVFINHSHRLGRSFEVTSEPAVYFKFIHVIYVLMTQII